MNSGIKYTLAFLLGAGAGAFVAWKVLEKKYDNIVKEEVASVKEELFGPFGKSESEKAAEAGQLIFEGFKDGLAHFDESNAIKEKLPDIRELAAKLQEEGYLQYAAEAEEKKEEKEERPYVLSPDEFGEI